MSMQLPRPAVVAFDAHTGNWQLLDIIVLPVLGDPLLAAGPSVVLECLTAVTAAQFHPQPADWPYSLGCALPSSLSLHRVIILLFHCCSLTATIPNVVPPLNPMLSSVPLIAPLCSLSLTALLSSVPLIALLCSLSLTALLIFTLQRVRSAIRLSRPGASSSSVSGYNGRALLAVLLSPSLVGIAAAAIGL